jgi:hypothetical protein
MMPAIYRQSWIAATCGLMSLVMVHCAYWLNIHFGHELATEFICNPYLEGCVSTSRAVRSGPGLIWFKAVMLPVAALMALTWYWAGHWLASGFVGAPALRRWTVRLGIAGAGALVFYVVFLGTEGPVYAWLRRYGVVFFFGFTALAQLLVARFVWGNPRIVSPWRAGIFLLLVFAQWSIGVFSVFKRLLFDDPDLVDRLENITEWWMIAAMSLGFILLGLLLTTNPRTRIVGGPRI